MTVPHPPVLVTDTKYRASLAAVQSLGRAGYPVAALHTQGDGGAPAAFASKYVKKRVILPCSAKTKNTRSCWPRCAAPWGRSTARPPVVFPVGAATLAQLAEHREELEGARQVFGLSPGGAGGRQRQAPGGGAGPLPGGCRRPRNTPAPAGALPEAFPVVVKPRCGEKFGLHAEERYRKAYDPAGFRAAWEAMARYDPQPVVQELLTGEAVGVLPGDGRKEPAGVGAVPPPGAGVPHPGRAPPPAARACGTGTWCSTP